MAKRIDKAVDDISAFFDASTTHVYTVGDLRTILAEQRYEWNLPASIAANSFIEFLLQKTKLRKIKLTSQNYTDFERYAWGDASPYSLALSVRRESYLSHASAIFLHALTDQIPKAVYANHEQSVKPKPTGGLSQESINRAFSNAQRHSNYVYGYDEFKLVLLSGKNTGNLGAIAISTPTDGSLSVTGIERTLIDIAVRPDYAGGVYHVLQAYRSAKSKASVSVLTAYLKKLDYLYPFHQVIGFYMQRAGYEPERWRRLREYPITFDFYLAHQMGDKDYDAEWRLFFPKGFQ